MLLLSVEEQNLECESKGKRKKLNHVKSIKSHIIKVVNHCGVFKYLGIKLHVFEVLTPRNFKLTNPVQSSY